MSTFSRALVCCLLLLIVVAPAAARSVTQPAVPAHDRLAYISAGKLYVGHPGATRVVPGPGVPSSQPSPTMAAG